MFRITTIDSTDSDVTLLLEGRITNPDADELKQACEEARRGGRHLALDLSGVSFLDREAVSVLRRLAKQRVGLAHCSAFVAEQLRTKRTGGKRK